MITKDTDARARLEQSTLPRVIKSWLDMKEEIKEILAENFRDPAFSRESLASRLNLSVSELSRKFRMLMGTTFPDYLNLLRLEEAKYQLIHSTKPVYKIALATGYRSIEHFCAVFRKYEEHSPRGYRESKS